jgi:hypothetical protein
VQAAKTTVRTTVTSLTTIDKNSRPVAVKESGPNRLISRTRGDAMKLIIEARVECTDSDLRRVPIRLAVLDRIDDDLEQLGLTLEEGRALLATPQSALISSHTEQWLATQDYCRRCCTPLYHKDSRSIVVRTVFGKITLQSPRFWSCECDRSQGSRRYTVSPLSQALPKRITPALEYLQVKWAAHLPYAAATALLKEVLPLQDAISTSSAKSRMRWLPHHS